MGHRSSWVGTDTIVCTEKRDLRSLSAEKMCCGSSKNLAKSVLSGLGWEGKGRLETDQ